MHRLTLGTAVVGPLAACLLGSAALAQSKTPQSSDQGSARNEKVCENITLTGSRLATKRFCGTRAEWEERRQRDRDAVEAAQRGPCVYQGNAVSGKPSC